MKNTRRVMMRARPFILAFILILINNHLLIAQKEKNEDKEIKLGLVLSGGGAKGFAHIGVLKVLEEEDIPITLISGNSIGTIVGALYSIGYNAQDIEDFVKEQNWEMLLLDKVPRKLKSTFKQDFEQKYLLQLNLSRKNKRLSLPSGFVRGNNIFGLFSRMTADISDNIEFSDLPIPFACVAYNLETGKEVLLNKGHLPRAMLSSMAIPGAFSPVNFNDMLLIDGGIINNFPVDVAKNMGADIIIGVDLKQKDDDNSHFASISSIFKGIVDKIEIEKHSQNSELADVIINPMLQGVSTFDFKASAVDSIIKSGEKAAREKLPQIRELVKYKDIRRNNKDINYKHEKEWLIKEIVIPEEFKTDTKLISSIINIVPDTPYSIDDIDKAMKQLFAYGNYDIVNYILTPNEDGYDLKLIIIKDKEESKVMFGAALNTVELATLYGNYSRQSSSDFINLLTIDTKIAVNPQIQLKLENHRMSYSAFGLEAITRYNKLNQYYKGEREGKMDIINASASIYSYRRYHNLFDIKYGLSQNYFNSNSYSRSSDMSVYNNTNGFYSTAYATLTIDSRNDIYIPKNGLFMTSKFSILANKGHYSDIIPIYFLQLNTVTSLSERFSLFADLYHRSIFNTKNPSLAFANYASNNYNSFSEYSFPVLGQPGIYFLKPISTMGELALRIHLFDKHYITPRFQTLLQFDEWRDINLDDLNWSVGTTYQTSTPLGPVDLTIGYQRKFNDFNLYGGIGYQF